MYIVSFFKNKGALTSIVLIVLFGLIFAAYYYFVMKMSFSTEGEDFDPQEPGRTFLRGVHDVCQNTVSAGGDCPYFHAFNAYRVR